MADSKDCLSNTNWKSAFIIFFSSFLLLIPFDGLFRVIALKTNSYFINGWKDAFLMATLYFGFIAIWARSKSGYGEFRVVHFSGTACLIMLGLFGIGLGLAMNSVDFLQGLWGFKILYLPIFLFILLQIYPADMGIDFPTKIIKALFFIAIPIVFFGVWQFFSGWRNVSLLFLDQEMQGGKYIEIITIGNYLRAFSTLRDHFAFGNFCSMLFIFNIALLLFSKGRKMIPVLTCFVLFAGIIVSTSRISIINGIIGWIFLLSIKMPFKKVKRKHIFILLFIVSIFLLFLGGYYIAYYFNPPIIRHQLLASLFGTSSVLPRIMEWQNALRQYPLNGLLPILFGWGTGVAGAAQAKFVSNYLFVDNFYILVLIMHGCLGLFVWITFLGAHLLKLINFTVNRENESRLDYWFVAGTAIFLATRFIEFLFATFLETYPGQIYFWVFLALSMRAIQVHWHEKTGKAI